MSVVNLRKQGMIYFQQLNYFEAEKCFRSCLANRSDPASDPALDLYNLGVVLAKQHKYQEAAAIFREALTHNPGLSAGYANLGHCYHEMGLIEASLQALIVARQINPNDSIAVTNEALALLTLGHFAEGWTKFEARWHRQRSSALERSFSQPLWHGADIQNKTILLHAEEGLGDSIHMARYAPMLEERGANVIVEVQASLVKLFRSLSSTITVIERGNPLPSFDTHVPMLSVPIGFHTTLATIPASIPYLKASQEDIHRYSDIMSLSGISDNKRIGLVWAGRPSYERDIFRSIPLKILGSFFSQPKIDWISLQHSVTDVDSDLFKSWGGHTLPIPHACDFYETAAVIMNLDLVITVDTAVAHLAGALGKPVWLLLSYVADWRWLRERQDSPWYPTMRLFRQKNPGDWTDVIDRIHQECSQFTASDSKK